MSTRDVALNIVNMMNDEQLQGFISLFQGVISNTPDEETIKYEKDNVNYMTRIKRRTAGGLQGSLIISDDFDEPLDCFKEYM